MKEIILQNHELGNILSSIDYFLKFKIPKKAKILDVGNNYGSLIFNLYKAGYKNVYGIDTNNESIKNGKKTYKEISKRMNFYDGKKIPFASNFFDVVLMFDVIEHIPNVKDFLKEEVYNVLKKNGIFIFQTPNKLINIPWEIINQKSFTKWKGYHCSLQTKTSLRKILEQSGFQKIIIEKNTILTQHNKSKVKRKIGIFGLPILYFLQAMPLGIYSNLWGNCRK